MLSRRALVNGMAAAAGALALPSPASTRFLSKLRWKEIIDVGGSVAGILSFLKDYFVAGDSGTPPKAGMCGVSRSDLATIQRLCFQLALATNTKDYQPAIQLGDGGLLSALAAYSEKPSESSWRRVRNEALVFSNTAQQLLTELGKSGGVVEALDPDQRARVLTQVKNALRVVNEAVWTIHSAGGEPDDPTAANEVLTTLLPLPALLQRAEKASNELIEARSKARC